MLICALAEELTGVRVTPELLDNATYSTGIVKMPDTEWDEIVIDLRDANGEGLVTREQVEQPMTSLTTPQAHLGSRSTGGHSV